MTSNEDSNSAAPVTPEVTWAQRSSETDEAKNIIYLTIVVPDIEKGYKIDLKNDSLSFEGISRPGGGPETKKYELKLVFYAEVDPKESKHKVNSQNIVFVIRKKDMKAEFWPRLQKGSQKLHFLKTDFDKWVDEDEQHEAPEEDMSQFGGMGGIPGMGGMPGMGGGDFGGIDFSRLGGAGGMPDLSSFGGPDLGGVEPDLGGVEGDDSEEDDDLQDETEVVLNPK